MSLPRRLLLAVTTLVASGCVDQVTHPTAPGLIQNAAPEPAALKPVSPTIRMGQTVTLTKPVNSGMALWLSANGNIAVVSQAGVVTGIAPGVALISAVYSGGSAMTSVSVTR